MKIKILALFLTAIMLLGSCASKSATEYTFSPDEGSQWILD